MKKLAIILALLAFNVYASSEAEHHGSPKDLIAPAVNFFLLFGFLIYKIKGPLAKFFDEKSKKISEVLDRAQVKSKEAQVLFDINTKKINDVENEVNSILKNADEDVRKFSRDTEKETHEKTEKLKSEAVLRIEAERKNFLNKLNQELVDDVVSKAKGFINNDITMKKDLTNKMVKEIR